MNLSREKERAARLRQQSKRLVEDAQYSAPKKQGSFTSRDIDRPIIPDEGKKAKMSEKASPTKKTTKSSASGKKTKKSKKAKADYRSKDERRREYAEAARKKRKKSIVKWLIFTFLIAAGVLVSLSLTVLFKIEAINTSGDTRYSQEEIIELSQVKIGDNLWRTTSKKVTQELSAALPYIKSVKVIREIPSGITLEVCETQPMYSIKKGKKFILTDESDKVLEENASKKGETVLLKGLEVLNTKAGTKLTVKSSESLSVAKEIIAAAKENSLELTETDVTQLNALTAVYKERIRLEFGSRSDLDKKMKMANEIIKKLESEGNTQQGVINLKSVTKSFFIEKSIDETKKPDSEDKKGGNTSEATSKAATDSAKEG